MHMLFINLLFFYSNVALSYQLPFAFFFFSFVCIGQYSDDNRIIRRIEQENGIESDEETERRTMFQANYQYTPLKDYAAMRNQRLNNDIPINSQPSKSMICVFLFFK